jgi:uncharacterized protein (DUF58 family)
VSDGTATTVPDTATYTGRPRPRRAAGPIAASILTMLAWEAVAHNSGSGWVQALGALLAAFILIGLFGPALAIRRVRVAVTSCDADGVAGTPSSLTLTVSRPVRLTPIGPPGETVLTGGRHEVEVTVVPEHRGVVTACELRVASAAPFGLLWWERRVALALPRPLEVSPRVGEPDRAALAAATNAAEDHLRRPARIGEPRGVRPYQAGDLRHWVHWPATAHAGSLMVREMEGPVSRPVVVEVRLPEDPAAAERQAERALGTVAGMLAAGRAVELRTFEARGPVTEEVCDVRGAGRRLARAV